MEIDYLIAKTFFDLGSEKKITESELMSKLRDDLKKAAKDGYVIDTRVPREGD